MPPMPLANLDILTLQAGKPNASNMYSKSGGAGRDLLIVGPNSEMTGNINIAVNGYRGIYFIGATIKPKINSSYTNGSVTGHGGWAVILKLKNHPQAQNAFVYVGNIMLDAGDAQYGDFLQVGSASAPDIYRCKIWAKGTPGWDGKDGGVNHADFMKFDMGYVRNIYTSNVDVSYGTHIDYLVGSYTTNRKPWRGPNREQGEAHYWNTVVRPIKPLDNYTTVAFWMSFNNDDRPSPTNPDFLANDYYLTTFHSEGSGNYIVPYAFIPALHFTPHNAALGVAVEDARGAITMTKPTVAGHPPYMTGTIYNGKRIAPPAVVTSADVGFARRVTSRDQLVDYLNKKGNQ